MKSYANHSFNISPRAKNKAFLLENGLSVDDAKNLVMSLTVAHYSKGPCSDDKDLNRNDLWVFGRMLVMDERAIEVYIKTVISETDDGLGCLCVSFHEAEAPLCHPYGGADDAPYILP